MINGILIGHGEFAAGLYSALKLIVGDVSALAVLSTQDKGRADIEQMILEARRQSGSNPTIVFADLQGGCSTTVCGSLLRACEDVGIICGANLPILIKFVEYRERLALRELYDLLVQTGKDSIKGLRPPC
jgi:PTS system N-acetylgalactosamine-specific IIA component